jgi:radical SAM protein with 4Fe4S-binding SPASM domain
MTNPSPPMPTEHRAKPAFLDINFDVSPFIVIWEITRACALRCVHCRAEAIPNRNPNELSWEVGTRMIDDIVRFNPKAPPLIVFTGGDPTLHPDLVKYISYADQKGLRVAVTPSATPSLTREKIREMREAGLTRMAISIDGPNAEIHDGFRKQPGSFDHTIKALRWALDEGLTIQVNTTISRWNINEIDAMCGLMRSFGLTLWAVFFLVPTGRGEVADIVTPQQHEQVFRKLWDLQQQGEFDIKTTAGPAYRRVVMQAQREAGRSGDSMRFQIPDRRGDRRSEVPTFEELEQKIVERNTARLTREEAAAEAAHRAKLATAQKDSRDEAAPFAEEAHKAHLADHVPGESAAATNAEAWAARPMLPGAWKPDAIGRAGRGVNDANGFVFIDHVGNVHPSGFMPYPAGNVNKQSLVDIYRDSSIFKRLRDYKQLKGKCRMCEFRDVCGGARSRSFGVTGDPMASEPYCVYVPEKLRGETVDGVAGGRPVDWLSPEMLVADMGPYIAKHGEV